MKIERNNASVRFDKKAAISGVCVQPSNTTFDELDFVRLYRCVDIVLCFSIQDNFVVVAVDGDDSGSISYNAVGAPH